MRGWRTRVVAVCVAGACVAAPAGAAASAHRGHAPQPTSDLTHYVDTFTGTASSGPDFGTGGGAGNTYPGAVLPFGMLSFSPDTVPSTVNFAAGYSYGDSKISGFSLTHLSGAGCANEQDVPIMPTTAAVTQSPAELVSSDINPRYEASFSHADESASPGHYAITLNPGTPSAIATQLTATTRAGAAEFSFPAGAQGSVLINPGASATADTEASVQIDPGDQLVTGSASSAHFCFQHNTYTVYFAARFDHPFAAYGTWAKQLLRPRTTTSSDTDVAALNYSPIPGGPTSLPGNPSSTAQAGAYLSFATGGGATVGMQVGISYVSAAAALANLDAETAGRSFAQLGQSATATWNRALGLARVSGGTDIQRRTYYTDLYHALLAPSVFSDEDGRYMGMDGQVHSTAPGHTEYANYSGWDVYRSEIPLLAMLVPGRVSDMAQSLVDDAAQSGALPKWSIADGQTEEMVGDPADAILADAYAFGARGFDTSAALRAMIAGATGSGATGTDQYIERPGLSDYERLGYIPREDNTSALGETFLPQIPWGSVSTTLEYATADSAIAQFAARAFCDAGDYRTFLARSGSWRNVFDTALGAPEPRTSAGPFAPDASATESADFVEGDAAQYTWAVPQDLAGLFAALGGAASARARLDRFMTQLNAGPTAPYAFLGNEPTLEVPWEYDWLGDPAGTESVVRRALATLYGDGPDGYPGNDDLGEMSSWAVLAALGFYPEIPGAPVLALGSPLFPRASVELAGHRVTITAAHAAANAPYVQSLTVGGRRSPRPWLSYAALSGSRRIAFRLGTRPSRWGTAAGAVPPSFAPGAAMPSCQAPG